MEEIIKYHLSNNTITNIINFDSILGNIDLYSVDTLMKLMYDPAFNSYINFINTEDEKEYDKKLDLLTLLYQKIYKQFRISEIRKIMLNVFDSDMTGLFLRRLCRRNNDLRWIILFCKDILTSKEYKRINDVQCILVEYGIYSGLNEDLYIDTEQLDTKYFHNCGRVIRYLIDINDDNYCHNIILMKMMIKINTSHAHIATPVQELNVQLIRDYCNIKIACYPRDLLKRRGVRRNKIEFIPDEWQSKTIDMHLRNSLSLTHRKFSNPRINMDKNTKLTYKLLYRIFAKFTTKNMTKLILYYQN